MAKNKKWTHLRVELHIVHRLNYCLKRMLLGEKYGHKTLPRTHKGTVSLQTVIDRLIDHYLNHAKRSKQSAIKRKLNGDNSR